MTTLILQRLPRGGAWTPGELRLGSIKLCDTLEEHPDNNKKDTCIPAGRYKLFIRPNAETRHDYDVIELKDVPGRTNIQIHIGNTLANTEGCILVASGWSAPGVLAGNSSTTYHRLLDHVRELLEMTGEVWLEVLDAA